MVKFPDFSFPEESSMIYTKWQYYRLVHKSAYVLFRNCLEWSGPSTSYFSKYGNEITLFVHPIRPKLDNSRGNDVVSI